MTQAIRITVGEDVFTAELDQSSTAVTIRDSLPIEGKGNRWGDEIYFSIPVDEPLADDAREEMEVGDLAFWPPGNAFCIFFGPTPVSRTGAPRAASPVNPIGRIVGDLAPLQNAADGVKVRIKPA